MEDLAARLHADVAAVVVIHYFGFPTDLDGVLPLVRTHGALLIEDCSHSFLTRDRGGWLGQRGDYAVFSYYKCTPSLVGGSLVANGNAPLPAAPDAGGSVAGAAGVDPSVAEGGRCACAEADHCASCGVRSPASRAVAGPIPSSVLPPPRFLDDPYLFDLSLARTGLPSYVRRIVEASPWEDIARKRRRNYAVLSRLIPDSSVLRRPLPSLPDGVVPFMFPLFFKNRRPHEAALREAGIPYLRFGEVLHDAVERASESARSDAAHLSGSLLLLPVHQDLDERQIEAYVALLLDYVARLPVVAEASAGRLP